ncbi:hypothetical protein [Halarcobacter sp.]|uniref:hypothetical protein n=1 Tax=Halarcobacter sp. TaxID=2321133 RepID=UPI0029F46751|nr:hypothetical protein [Halarcobacter sp.]
MSHYKVNIEEHHNEIHQALNSTDLKLLKKLSNSKSIGVRRSLAQNSALNTEIANSLAYDPVLNVSYMATLHENCTVTREFRESDLAHKCIVCTVDERHLDCSKCDI